MDKDKKVLKEVIEAWESLPEGHYSMNKIQRWLVKKMKPAIDNARTQVKK